jgi:2-methylcitrate dehydratase PrpD
MPSAKTKRIVLTDALSRFVGELGWSALPARIQERARDRVLDAISTAVASQDVDVTRTARAAADSGGACTVLPGGGTSGTRDAALVNGVAVHAILFEDINLASVDHPGAVVVPAALAAVEEAGGSMGDLLTAVVAGYEVQLYLGAIATPGVVARGFRTTSVFGSVGAAAAAAKAFRLERTQIAAAIALGANLACGFIEAWAHGTMEPYLQAGAASANGILAARLAWADALIAPPTFEGPNGYLRAFAGEWDPQAEIGGAWRIEAVSCKPYPISGAKLSTVDSALAARREGLDPAAIRAITVRVPTLTKDYPGGDRKGPFATMPQAQDSTQFCVAAALLGRPMTALATFIDGYGDPEISDLTQRIEVVGEPDRQIARVEIELSDGSLHVAEVDERQGHVPSVTKMADKLRELTAPHWPTGTADAVIKLICGDPLRPVAEVSRLMRV